MSRDGWMKKKANASDDNGWAERVSSRATRSGCTRTLSDDDGGVVTGWFWWK